MHTRKICYFCWFVFVIVVLASCSIDDPLGNIKVDAESGLDDFRGQVVSYELLESFTKQEVAQELESVDPFITALFNPKYGVDVYKIVYETIDPLGHRIEASGAVVIPNDATKALPFASYQHGTIFLETDIPSNMGYELTIGLGMATTGYMVSLPDYLGFGADESAMHPYVHAKSEATASVDMLRASVELNDLIGTPWNDQLFLFGYSQGGHATMATHRELEVFHKDEFTVTACAPMSGPYDISGVQAQYIVRDRSYANPSYLPYVVLGLNSVYDIMPLSDIFLEPYLSQVVPMYDGYHSGWQVDQLMPLIPNQVIIPELLDDINEDPEHIFWKVLRDQDTYNWLPTAPIKLYYCEGDEQVDYVNSIVAFHAFKARGAADVELMMMSETFDHGDCAIPCFINAKNWFDSLRE